MAATRGQTSGEPLSIEEAGPAKAPAIGNYVMNNDSTPHVGETLATGKVSVHAGVSVVFRLQG